MNDRMKIFYMNVAEQCARMSRAVRLKVGAVVVKDNNIVSFSWNGTPAGWDNCCEDHEYMSYNESNSINSNEIHTKWPYENAQGRYKLVTKPEVLHAERNALDKLAKGNQGGLGATLFVTHCPCLECAKSIYGAGITEVFYKEDYRSNDGIEFLKKCNVTVTKIKGVKN